MYTYSLSNRCLILCILIISGEVAVYGISCQQLYFGTGGFQREQGHSDITLHFWKQCQHSYWWFEGEYSLQLFSDSLQSVWKLHIPSGGKFDMYVRHSYILPLKAELHF